MLFNSIKLVQGSEVQNLVIDTGLDFPLSASEGQLFFIKDGGSIAEGLYVYDGGNWLMTNNSVSQQDIVDALGFTPADIAGDTFTGPVYLAGSPTLPLEATPKSYVDSLVGSASSGAQPIDSDLTAIANITTTGLLRRTGPDTWITDSSAYITGNENIDVIGDAVGSGTTSISLTLSNTGVTAGIYGSASTSVSANVDSKGRLVSASAIPIEIDASQTISGTFNDARISASSISQHQASLSITESQITDGSLLARLADDEVVTGNWTFNNAIVGATPSLPSHLTTKDYVDNIASGVAPQKSVRVATTSPISLSGIQNIDGFVCIAGDRVLVKDQVNQEENGIYVMAAVAWLRAADFDGSPTAEVSTGSLMYVEQGISNGNSSWILITNGPITIGTTPLEFTVFSRPGDYEGGAGLTKSGNTFNVGTASASRIVVNPDNIDLAITGTVGTYTSVTTDAYGRVINGSNPGFITGNQNITLTGDISGTGTTSITTSLANSGVSAGTYGSSVLIPSFTVDAKGRITNVTSITPTPAWSSITGKPTTVSGYGITDAFSTSSVIPVGNGGTGSTSAEGACDNIGAPRINPSTPKDGDIQVSGSVISIYAAGGWRQIFPAVYS